MRSEGCSRCAQCIEKDAEKNKIDALFAEVDTRVIDANELRNAGFGEEMFCNVNTPDDWEKAQAEL